MRLACLAAFACLASCTQAPQPAAAPAPPLPPKITHFYPNASPIPKGELATVCYGTTDADEVSLTPYDDTLKPSLNRCISLDPAKATEYTLTAKGRGGEAKQTLKLEIGTATPRSRELITSFNALNLPNQPAQLCYTTTADTASISVQPTVTTPLRPGKNQCFPSPVSQKTTFILTARAADGSTDRMQVTVNPR